MTRAPHSIPRNIRYVVPRLQGGAALLFAAVVAAGGTVFGVLAGKTLRQMLLSAAVRGHYPMRSAYEIVREPLAWHLVALFAGIFLAATAMFVVLAWAARRGIDRVDRALRASADRDLSTPTRVRGFAEAARLGGLVDEARAGTLDLLRSIRTEAENLAGGGVPAEEFRVRWDALKQTIRGIAP
jgi:hypothetical protein